MTTYGEWYSGLLAILYSALPFMMEIRCLLDFCFSKTALDVFQFLQLFIYHIDLYKAKAGNLSYVSKVFGAKVLIDDLIIGWVVLGLLLFLLIGPIIFFSEYSFVQFNPVKDAEISVALVVSKNLTMDQLKHRSVWNWQDEQDAKKKALKHISNYGSDDDEDDEDDDEDDDSFEGYQRGIRGGTQLGSRAKLGAAAVMADSHDFVDMPFKNSYIGHPDEEIDFDIIFGRKSGRESLKRVKKAHESSASKKFKGSINLVEEEEEEEDDE